MSCTTQRRRPNNNPCRTFIIVVILILIASVLIGIIRTPSFVFDDLIYTLIVLAIILVVIFSCPAVKKRAFPVRKRCSHCGCELPPGFKVGQYCPNCHLLIDWEKSSLWSFGRKKSGGFRPRSGAEYEEIPGGGYKYTPEPTGARKRQKQKPEKYFGDHDFDSSNNPEISPFNPPFDELFIDQKQIRWRFKHFINWAAVGFSLENWVEEVKNDRDKHARGDNAKAGIRSIAEKDATAKLDAWRKFERNGFTEPQLLPQYYRIELQTIEAEEETVQEDVETRVHCPYCGSLDYQVEGGPGKSDKNGEDAGEKRYKCKDCGEFFTRAR